MNTPAPLEIFKPGTHTAMSGAVLDFSESDLQATADAYDPELHEAPLVVGHPKIDAPAYGWVKSLNYADGGLAAERDQVDPAFAEMVRAGRFKKVSASFFSPDSQHNPVPGVYYLRHVGFLGATPPAVKGLKAVSFSESDEGIVEFGDWDDRNNAGLWRSMREWLIAKFGMEEADKAVPSLNVQALSDSAAQPEPGDTNSLPSFSEEPNPKGDEMSAEDKARLAALEEENRKLKADQATFAEAEAKRTRDAAHADHASFAEGLVQGGKLLPAQKAVAVATLDLIAAQDVPVEFGEGDDKAALTVDGVKTFLQALPKQVEFGEHAAGDADNTTVSFAAPGGYSVDAGALEIHARAVAFQAANPNTEYLDAVKAVSK